MGITGRIIVGYVIVNVFREWSCQSSLVNMLVATQNIVGSQERRTLCSRPPFMQTAHYAECISVVSDTKLSVLFVFMRFKGRLI